MTEQEAIKYIQEHNTISGNVKDIAIEALEKQIPKKPNDYDGEIKVGFCPDCDNVVTDNYYCEHCGQALDWSEN